MELSSSNWAIISAWLLQAVQQDATLDAQRLQEEDGIFVKRTFPGILNIQNTNQIGSAEYRQGYLLFYIRYQHLFGTFSSSSNLLSFW